MDFQQKQPWLVCISLILLTTSVFYIWKSANVNSTPITNILFRDYDPITQKAKTPLNSGPVDENVSPPIILFWTDFFSQRFNNRSEDLEKTLETLSQCPEVSCQISSDRRDVNRSSAVMLHPRDMEKFFDIPEYRNPGQYYVFYLLESPFHSGPSLDAFKPGFFNLTFTYRLDSDVVSDLYLRNYKPETWKSTENFEELWARKTKFAAYFESYCSAPSLRRLVINELSAVFPIDMYGACGTLKCEKNEQGKCDELLKSYKFFFAFENSICRDYVTEKIHRAFNLGVIPVVLGGANYSAMFPPSSFIDAMNFPSVNELAVHLDYIARNKEPYESYLKWRLDPIRKQLPERLQSGNLSWCTLCKLLNQKKRRTKIVPNVKAWWEETGVCTYPYNLLPAAQQAIPEYIDRNCGLFSCDFARIMTVLAHRP